jgi:hypothetical protein
LKKCSELPAEIIVTEFPVDSRTRFFDDLKIVLIVKYARVQGPLGATPGFTCMDGTSVIIKNAMSINNLHLNGVAILTPIFMGDLLSFHAQVLNHSFLVIFIE